MNNSGDLSYWTLLNSQSYVSESYNFATNRLTIIGSITFDYGTILNLNNITAKTRPIIH